jgi:hypothetical protein
MQDESSRALAEEDERVQAGILRLLLASGAERPWSVAEIEREVGEQIATADGLASLHAAGLIHRCGEFVFATRAALHMDGLSL